MTLAPERTSTTVRNGDARLPIARYFTKPETDPYDELAWELRSRRHRRRRRQARLRAAATSSSRRPGRRTRRTSSPRSTSAGRSRRWTRGRRRPSASGRSRQLIDRVVNTITGWGWEDGYFARRGRARDVPRGAEVLPRQPDASASTRRSGSTSAMEEHPQCSACFILSIDDSIDSILDWYRTEGKIFKGGSRLRHQPLEAAQLEGARHGRRPGLRAGLLHARRRLRGRARSSPAARPAARPRWSSSTSTTRTSRSSSGARRRRSARPTRWARPATTCRWTATPGSASSTRTRTTPSASPTTSCVRVEDDGEWQTRYVTTARSPAQTYSARKLMRRHRAGRLGVRRPGHAVPHDDQRLAHLPEHRADQRLQPLLRVHAPGRQRLQPGLDQPAEVPRRGRQLRRRGLQATRSR